MRRTTRGATEMVVSGRVTATVGFVVDAVSVTLRSVALSLVGPAFVAAGGGLVSLSLRHLDGFSSAKNGASGRGRAGPSPRSAGVLRPGRAARNGRVTSDRRIGRLTDRYFPDGPGPASSAASVPTPPTRGPRSGCSGIDAVRRRVPETILAGGRVDGVTVSDGTIAGQSSARMTQWSSSWQTRCEGSRSLAM